MTIRLFLPGFALCILAASASAQTAENPAIVPLPAPPLVVPIVPTPLDGATQNALDQNTPRTYEIRLRHVKPSVMAYWLDPKNHAVPLESGRANSALSSDWKLPEGIERVVAVDPQNALLVLGTARGIEQLRPVIQLLDRPARIFRFVVPQPRIEFETSIFWIDSLAPNAPLLGVTASKARIATPAELDLLEGLRVQDRATLRLLPTQTASSNASVVVQFAPATATAFPKMPNLKGGEDFDYIMPRFGGNADIDPGIQPNGAPRIVRVKLGEIRLTPIGGEEGALSVQVQTANILSQIVPMRDGDTLVLSGSAQAMGLQAPSPRFDSFVLQIKARLQTIRAPGPQLELIPR